MASTCTTTTIGGPTTIVDIKGTQNDDLIITFSSITIGSLPIPSTSSIELFIRDSETPANTFTIPGVQDTQNLNKWIFEFEATDNAVATNYDFVMRLTDDSSNRTTIGVGRIFINADL